jgi:uncharacterized protein (UPF0335 family)
MNTTTPGQNTVASEQLRAFIERIENVEARMADEREARKSIYAEAKAMGFSTRAIRYLIKLRTVKPQDRFEWEQERDMYVHSAGLASEPPLQHALDLAGVDPTVREQVIEAMGPLVPTNGKGHIDLTVGGKTMRLSRDKNGKVSAAEVVPQAAPPTVTQIKPVAPKDPVPDVDENGATELGRQYAKDNKPVIANPFPFGDPRRARFDEGWRKETGGDGMGPDEK